jgi:AraC-like DNA-binding protein
MAMLPSIVVDTDRVAPRERFALWREALSATHEAALPEDSDPARFSAFARGFNLGPALLIETRASAQRLVRSPRAVRADQIDHYIIRLQRRGRWSGEAGERALDAATGTVVVLDMAQSTAGLGVGIDNINLLLPRDALDAVLPPFDMHGLVLHGAMAHLLRNHLVALADNLSHVPAAQAADVAEATCRLAAACLAPSRERVAHARVPLALARLAEIRRYIDRHLTSPALSPEAICKALGLSRSSLYAACEPLGGVAALIQRQRLARVRAILDDPWDLRPISTIAYEHGFVSNAHFSRAFRRAFGCTPRDARAGALALADRGGAERNGDAYATWMRRLGS